MLSPPPKDFTNQENILADILSELGIRYERQYQVGKYILDFFLPEPEQICIEADGPTLNHYGKKAKKRDQDLLDMGVLKVIHLKSQTRQRLKDELLEKLCLD